MATDHLELVATLGSTVLKHNGGIRCVQVSPDGKRIVSVGDGSDVHVWDASTGARLADLEGTDRGLYALAISPDGKRVFAGGHHATIFELVTRKCIQSLRVKKPLVVAAAFGPDNSIVFGDDRVPRRFDAKGTELPPLVGHLSRVEAIAISRDGRRALTAGGDRKVKLHALDGKKPAVIATWDGSAKSCGFSPDGTLAWSAGWDHATVRGTTTGKSTFAADAKPGMRLAAMSVDGSRFAVATDEAIMIYALPGKQQIARLAFGGANTIAFTPDGARLVVANPGRGLGEGCGINVFDIESERRVLPADAGHTRAVEDLAIAPRMPHVLYTLGADGLVVMWDLDTGSPMERIGTIDGQGRALATTTDGQTLVTASDTNELLVWNVPRTESARFVVYGRSSVDVAISQDDRLVAFAPYLPGQIQVFELATRELVMTCKPHHAQMCCVAFASPDVVVTGSADGTAIATKVPTGERLWTASCSGFVNAVCIVGDAVVTGSSDGQIATWDAVTGAARTILRASGREVQYACTVDADHIAVIQRAEDWDSSSVGVWCVSERRVVATADLTPIGDRARRLTASPDGRRIYVGTNGSLVLVFERTMGVPSSG